MEILVWLAILALPVAVLIALAGAIVGLVIRRRPSTFVLSAVVGVSLAVWVSATLASGVRADETGTAGNIYSDAIWLVVAVAAGVAAAGLGLRARHGRLSDRAAR